MNELQRRRLLIAFGASAVVSPLPSFAQKPVRIGFLTTSGQADSAPRLEAFKDAFRQHGYIEGKDFSLESRFAGGNLDRLPGLADELVKLRMDLIMTYPGAPTLAAKKATSTIPIVMISAGDPVGEGIVKSLGRPGGNVTGTSSSMSDIAPKILDLLNDAVPGLSRLAVFMNPHYQSHRDITKALKELAPRVGVEAIPVEVRSAAEIPTGFATLAERKARALLVVADPNFLQHRKQIAELALKNGLPSISFNPTYADAGFLIGYGADLYETWRRSAYYVDKILKGAKPADLPVEQPTKFELVINLKTANALSIKIPSSVLLRANRVIE